MSRRGSGAYLAGLAAIGAVPMFSTRTIRCQYQDSLSARCGCVNSPYRRERCAGETCALHPLTRQAAANAARAGETPAAPAVPAKRRGRPRKATMGEVAG